LLTAFASAEVKQPNVVLIFADDMGYGDVTSYDAKSKIHTPNLDRLAKGGMRFTDAHSASAVCTPSRYALLTGRYSWRTGLKSGVLGGFSQPLIEKGRMTLAHLFQDKGYRTACIGKWHLGMDWAGGMRGEKGYNMRNNSEGIDFTKPIQNTATVNGFDEFFGIAASLDMPPYVFIRNDRVTEQPTSSLKEEDKGGRQGPAVPGWRHKHVMPTFTDEVISFIQRNRQSPFFVYMPLNAPHTPHAPGDAFVGKSKLDIYGDFMVEVDHHIGRVMDELDRLIVEAGTVISAGVEHEPMGGNDFTTHMVSVIKQLNAAAEDLDVALVGDDLNPGASIRCGPARKVVACEGVLDADVDGGVRERCTDAKLSDERRVELVLYELALFVGKGKGRDGDVHTGHPVVVKFAHGHALKIGGGACLAGM
jgi:hypothetical protein